MAQITSKERVLRKELLSEGLKFCSKCCEVKKVTEFSLSNHTIDGYIRSCKLCTKISRHAFYLNNKELLKNKQKEYRKNNKDKIRLNFEEYYKNNKEKLAFKNKKYRLDNKDTLDEYNKKYRLVNGKILAENKRTYYRSKCTSKYFVSKINTEDISYRAKFEGCKLLVKCYYCRKWYNPTYGEVNIFITHKSGFGNIYCSNQCKQNCLSFGIQTNSIHPDSILYIEKSDKQKARSCQTAHLKQLQLDEFGHNYCEKCGTKGDIELHHTLEVAKFGLEAINSAGHLLLCKTCHKEFTKTCINT